MKFWSRQWILSSSLALAFGVAALAPATGRAAESCESIQAWVQQNAQNLPTTYEEFITYSEPYRRAMMAVLSPEVKSALWTRHLALYLASHPNLTAEQADVIHQAIFLAAPKSFMKDQADATRAALESLKVNAAAVFLPDEAARILAHLGPQDSPMVPMRPDCDCNDDFDCGGVGTCQGIICNLSDGCGPFWTSVCHSVCR